MPSGGSVTLTLIANSEGWRWRLVAGNHRGIAVAPAHYSTSDDAAAAAQWVASLAGDDALTAQFLHPESALTWRWTAVDDASSAIATGERVYARYGTCVSAYQRFLHSLHAWASSGEPAVRA